MTKKCILWGSSGHAKVVAEMLKRQGNTVVALIDLSAEATAAVPDAPLFSGTDGFADFLETWDNGELTGFACIGGGRGVDRLACLATFRKHGIATPAIVSQHAVMSASAEVAQGCHVMPGAVVAADVSLAEACIVNHGAIVDHECVLGPGVHVAPGATLTGCITVAANAFIGAGATVLPRLTIGEGAVIGAGATVTRSVQAGEIVVGTPAKPIVDKDS